MTDEHGMPLPPEQIPLPLWIDREQFVDTVRDKIDEEVSLWDMMEFFVHAANWIIPCREIVLRLKEIKKATLTSPQVFIELMDDAAELWAEMQREKGGK